jgi:hypothetical protein
MLFISQNIDKVNSQFPEYMTILCDQTKNNMSLYIDFIINLRAADGAIPEIKKSSASSLVEDFMVLQGRRL